MTAIASAKQAAKLGAVEPLARLAAAEIFGTFVLVFVDAGGAVIGRLGPDAVTPVGRALATGLTIMALIYSLGPRSGAHLNPSVTFAFALRRDFPWRPSLNPRRRTRRICIARAAAAGSAKRSAEATKWAA